MVSIENLKANTVWSNLAALVHWISDPHTVNKLRVNCHGAGTSTGGFSMGEVEMSPAEFVDALVRHGLTRPATHRAPVLGLAHGARWKLDSEKAACENGKCLKKFSIVRRKHHCRRCGGLFCDACSSKKLDLAVALTGENNATAKNVKKARVCNTCYNAVAGLTKDLTQDAVLREVFGASLASAPVAETSETKYGLQQITLALCLGAMTGDEFSPERDPSLTVGPQAAGTFVRDSLANRVLGELRRHNLRGIRLSASNQEVKSSEGGILNLCGVSYPTDSVPKGVMKKSFQATTNEFDVPAYIWGSRKVLRVLYAPPAVPLPSTRPAGEPQFTRDITVSPCGRSLHFSECVIRTDLNFVHNDFLNHWTFASWQKTYISLPPQFGPQPGAGAGAGAGAGIATKYTWNLTAPPRVTRIEFVPAGNDRNRIQLTGREEDSFKQYKSYEVS